MSEADKAPETVSKPQEPEKIVLPEADEEPSDSGAPKTPEEAKKEFDAAQGTQETPPELLEANERIGELEAEKAELEAELVQAKAAVTSMSEERANAELVDQLAQARESLAEREATLLELSKPMTKEEFQRLAKQNPSWVPEKIPGLDVKDYMRRCSAVADGLADKLGSIVDTELKELREIQRLIRTGGISADQP